MLAAAWKLICEMALASYWAVVRRNSVDVGHGDDVDLEVHVDLPDGRVAAPAVYFGGGHGCLLGLCCLYALSFQKEDLNWSSYW